MVRFPIALCRYLRRSISANAPNSGTPPAIDTIPGGADAIERAEFKMTMSKARNPRRVKRQMDGERGGRRSSERCLRSGSSRVSNVVEFVHGMTDIGSL